VLAVSVLGELSVEADGRPLGRIASQRARSLVGWLAIHPGLHSRARVASVFWPDVLDESARGSLRTTLATLRRELGPGGANLVTATRERVGIVPGEVQIDFDAFAQLASRGELEKAAALCRGDLLADLDDDWVNEPREYHRRVLLELLGRIAAKAEDAGDLDAALVRTREQVALDPLSEEAHRELIRRLAAAGDRAGALAAYKAYATRLRSDLELAPSAGMRELAEAIRAGNAGQGPSGNGKPGPDSGTESRPPGIRLPAPNAPTETRYAKSGDLSIAYQVAGTGEDVVFVSGSLSHVELGWETPVSAAVCRRLSGFARLITFDKRGMGLSDRTAELPTLEERMDDVRAVMDAAGCEKAAIVGVSEGGAMALLFAATYPERVRALVLWGTFSRLAWAPDYPDGIDVEEAERGCDQIEHVWGQGIVWPVISINDAPDDEETRRHLARFERAAATPAMASAANRFALHIDARHALPAISAPTLVAHRSGDPVVSVAHARYLTEHIRGARLAEFPGDFHFSGRGKDEEVLDEIEGFLTGTRQEHEIDRVLKTILFVDVADSTKTGAGSLLDERDATAGREIEAHQGQLIKSTGDGFLAAFDRPAMAIRCAQALRHSLSLQGIEIRTGLHTGEIELRGEDVDGMALQIAARVASRAQAGQTLASRTVRDLVVGSEIEFEEQGAMRLEDVPGEWELLSVTG
jgi:pimeloyl-ACP methyl ester carboxylesterase/DNA-binding SARP family transcriptional activator